MSFLNNFRRNQCHFLFRNMILLRNDVFAWFNLPFYRIWFKNAFDRYRGSNFTPWRLWKSCANRHDYLLIFIINWISDNFIIFDFLVDFVNFLFLGIIVMFRYQVILLCFQEFLYQINLRWLQISCPFNQFFVIVKTGFNLGYKI